EIAGEGVLRIDAKATIEVCERRGPVAARAIDFRQGVPTGGLPGVVPSRLGKGGISLGEQRVASEFFFRSVGLGANTATELVVGFAVSGIGIARGGAGDAGAEMFFRVGELAAPQMPATEREMATGVAGIAAQRL